MLVEDLIFITVFLKIKTVRLHPMASQKYPLKNVLFTVANQTYSTYVNAMTAPTFTTYPVSSMSEEQLLKLTDVYLDCVYHPSVYNDKNIFSREAWRYEIFLKKIPLD